MKENRETIIFDSSGLTALMNETDEFHTGALSMSEILTDRALWRVVLPREIFAETVTALSKRVNREAGAKAAWAILDRQQAGDFVFSAADQLVYKMAIDLLRTAKGSRGAPSFFDCLVMAFAKHYQTPYIFGFDEVFAKNGYQLPESPNRKKQPKKACCSGEHPFSD
jgi:predicted nucleic acid-binding protein